jgi:hypothetical protein
LKLSKQCKETFTEAMKNKQIIQLNGIIRFLFTYYNFIHYIEYVCPTPEDRGLSQMALVGPFLSAKA